MQPSELADAAHAASGNPPQRGLNGGRFDFDDGGTYCGGWEDGKAHGHGVCTGPKAQGAYAGSWHFGFEVSGVYTWPSGSSYEGQWQNGKRHGLGVETRDRWLYRGEWTQGYKGRYGVRQSTISNAKYEGTWANGLQDGYGSETYADGGTYQGQWMRGSRHGYGVRVSAPFGLASHYRGGGRGHRGSLSSLTEAGGDPSDHRAHRMDDARGGFVLTGTSDVPTGRRRSIVEKYKKGLFGMRKQRSAGDLDKHGTESVHSVGSGGSGSSWVSSVESTHSAVTQHTNSNTSFIVEDEHLDASVTETYMGEWKNDKRTGYGISERSDGLRYEGEWYGNRKYGYGVTTFRDGTREEGKYKNNELITSQKRKHLFLMRSAKFRERVDSAVNAAQRASKIALQKADIAISRTATARGKAEQADEAADQAKEDCELAQTTAKQFAPDFKHPGFDRIGLREKYRQKVYDAQVAQPVSQESEKILDGKSIPNHIPPMHSQLPDANKMVNQIPPRRLSTQVNKSLQPMGPKTFNNYNSENRTLNSPQDPYYSPNQGNWISSNQYSQVADTKPYLQNEKSNIPGVNPSIQQGHPSLYRNNNRDQPLQYNQNIEPINQQMVNQIGQHGIPNRNTRIDSISRPPYNQGPAPQLWNTTQMGTKRPSLAPQPAYNAQEGVYTDRGPGAYDRNGYSNSNTGNTEIPLDRQNLASEPQAYRQNIDAQGYEQGYRQTSHQQMYNQNFSDNQGYRSQATTEQDVINGARENRQPGTRPSIDYFDHYKRPPSRDSSVDRYGRRSRQPSVEAVAPSVGSRSGSVAPQPAAVSRPPSRAATPSSPSSHPSPAGNGHLASGRGSMSRASSREHQPFEDSLLRKRNLGQEISPSPYQPKRTESLYVAPAPTPPPAIPIGGGGGGRKNLSTPQTLQRKKSLPDVAGMPRMPDGGGMSREEVSALGSARREEIRRMHEETEKLRANPLLYLVSPQVKDWFSRQQLVIVVLFINISLGIMFFKLLT